MRYLTILSILTFSITVGLPGCGDYSNAQLEEDLEFISAVPAKEVMELRVADSNPRVLGDSGQELEIKQDPLLGQLAEFYVSSLKVTAGINKGVLGFLDVVDQIVRYFPPVLREKDRRVWGPWPSDDSPDLDVRFSMLKKAPGEFGIFFQLRPSDSSMEFDEGWIDCVYGQVKPQGLVRRGTGTLLIDLDSCSKLDKNSGKGTATVLFDTAPDDGNTLGKTELSIDFQNYIGRDGLENGDDPLTAKYFYLERSDKSGEFDFRTWTDVHADTNPQLDALEQWDWVVRWSEDGCGRADLRISGGDLGDFKAIASECWNTGHKRVYFSNPFASAPDPSEEGSEADCCLGAASFTN